MSKEHFAILWLDRAWKELASVKLTVVILLTLLVLSIPGTVILQYNISNVDPGLQYDYEFWQWGQFLGLFSSYHSFWYVGLIVILSMNLIACSTLRWPTMFRLATMAPQAWTRERFLEQPKDQLFHIKTPLNTKQVQERLQAYLKTQWLRPHLMKDGNDGELQLFWQTGRWSRLANVLVHTSLLVVFFGAIITAMYGFEGAANIPAGGSIDSFVIFKEGKAAGLQKIDNAPMPTLRRLPFRVHADRFDVEFYPDFPGRPKDFISDLRIVERGKDVKSATIRVNYPMEYKGMVFYQASYGRMGEYDIGVEVYNKATGGVLAQGQVGVGTPLKVGALNKDLVVLRVEPDVMGIGPGVLFQEFQGDKPLSEPFWTLLNLPQFDYDSRRAEYTIELKKVKERFFTGLQIGYDPGAPIYWLGCLGMLIGTFYALFVTHRKFYFRVENGEVLFTGTIHRLPMGFREQLERIAGEISDRLKEQKV